MTQWTDRNGLGLTLSHDGGRVTAITDSAGRTVTLGWGTGPLADRIVGATGSDGRTTSYSYDNGWLASATAPDGAVVTYAYDAAGRLARAVDPLGHTTFSNVYDATTGRITSQSDALGKVTTFQWNGVTATTINALGNTTRDTYSGNVLTSTEDANRKRTLFTYDEALNRVSVTDARGAKTSFGYDTSGNQTSRTSPQGDTETWAYDAEDRETQHVDGRGGVTTRTYDVATGRIATLTTPAGNTTSWTYRPDGLPASVTDPRGNRPGAAASDFTTVFGYDAGLNHTFTTSPLGAVTTYRYDQAGRLTRVVDPRGNEAGCSCAEDYATTTTYDQVDRVLTITNPAGGVATNTYDQVGRLVARTDPAGVKVGYTYDPAGRVLTQTDTTGQVVHHVHVRRRRSAEEPDPRRRREDHLELRPDRAHGLPHHAQGQRRRLQLQRRQLVVLRVRPGRKPRRHHGSQAAADLDELRRSRSSCHDSRRAGQPSHLRLRRQRQPDQRERRCRHDEHHLRRRQPPDRGHRPPAAGHHLRLRPRGLADEADLASRGDNHLDLRRRQPRHVPGQPSWQRTGGAGAAAHTTTYAYDAAGNLVSTRDARGHTTTTSYDARSNRVALTDANARTTRWTYDVASRLTGVQAPDAQPGEATALSYDSNGQLARQTTPTGAATTYAYDRSGRLVREDKPVGRWTHSYDPNGNRTLTVTANGNATTTVGDGQITTTYDALDQPTKIDYSDTTPDVTYTYDALGRRTRMVDGTGTRTYTYDALDRLTSTTTGSSTTARTWAWTYLPDDSLETATRPDGSTATWTYTPDSYPAKVTLPAGETSFAHDVDGNLRTTSHPNGTVETLDWDPTGNLTGIRTTKNGTTLTGQSITRDPVGNPVQTTTTRNASTDVRSYRYDPNDRLQGVCYTAATSCTSSAAATQWWTYDRNGNRLTEKNGTGTGTTTTFTYDTADRLISRRTGTATANTSTYDANGNQLTDGTTTNTYGLDNRLRTTRVGTGTVTTLLRNGDGLPTRSTTGTAVTNWDWDLNHEIPTLATATLGTSTAAYWHDQTGRALTMRDTTGTTTTDLTLAHDAIGSITDLISSTGATTRSFDYTPYGTPRTTVGAPTTPAGPTTGLQYAGMLSTPAGYLTRDRLYTPGTGRWTGPDPVPWSTSAPYDNTYTYVAHRPTVDIDPLGAMCNVNPFTASPNACGIYNTAAATIQGHGPLGFIAKTEYDFMINFGRGASVGLTDVAANAISPGASSTVTHTGWFARTSQVAGFVAVAYVSRGSAAPVGGVRVATTGTTVARYDAQFALGQITSSGRASASQLERFAASQGWVRSQTATGPIKFRDARGVVRVTIKRGTRELPAATHPMLRCGIPAGSESTRMEFRLPREARGITRRLIGIYDRQPTILVHNEPERHLPGGQLDPRDHDDR